MPKFLKYVILPAIIIALAFLIISSVSGGKRFRWFGTEVKKGSDEVAETADRIKKSSERAVEAIKETGEKVKDSSDKLKDGVKGTGSKIKNIASGIKNSTGEAVDSVR